MALLLSVLEQGLIYGMMGLGVYITYKILDFPDLTVDGSFPMGAAIACVLIIRGVPPVFTLPVCSPCAFQKACLSALLRILSVCAYEPSYSLSGISYAIPLLFISCLLPLAIRCVDCLWTEF